MFKKICSIASILMCSAMMCTALTGCAGFEEDFVYHVYSEASQLENGNYYVVDKAGAPYVIVNDEQIPFETDGHTTIVDGYAIAVKEYVNSAEQTEHYQLIVQTIEPEADLIIPGAKSCTSYFVGEDPHTFIVNLGWLRILSTGQMIDQINQQEVITTPAPTQG